MNRYARELSVLAALGLLLIAMAILAPGFYQPQPLLSLLTREAPTFVVACGMALVILCRQIDISVGSQFSVCGVAAGMLAAAKVPLITTVAGANATTQALRGIREGGLELIPLQDYF